MEFLLERIGSSCYSLNIRCIINIVHFVCILLVPRKKVYMYT